MIRLTCAYIRYSLICGVIFFGVFLSEPVLSSRVKTKDKTKMAFLDSLTKEQVIPDVIDAQPSAEIEILYKSGVKVEQGKELTPTQVQHMPEVKFAADPGHLYTLAMIDPDAPSRQDPKLREILHWLVANIPGNDLSKGDTLAAYIGSGPPEGTGLHRYVFLVYHQKEGKLTSSMNIPNNSRKGRPNFFIRKFAKDNKLDLIAANFYQAKYDDYVPQLHAQLSQG